MGNVTIRHIDDFVFDLTDFKPEPLIFTGWDWEYYLWNNNLIEIGDL